MKSARIQIVEQIQDLLVERVRSMTSPDRKRTERIAKLFAQLQQLGANGDVTSEGSVEPGASTFVQSCEALRPVLERKREVAQGSSFQV